MENWSKKIIEAEIKRTKMSKAAENDKEVIEKLDEKIERLEKQLEKLLKDK